jgi:20S proteasome alpha/beta subunit
MTVCVAATCENGAAVVIAADRLLSGQLQVEAPAPKVIKVADRCVAAFAGNEGDSREIIHFSAARIARSGKSGLLDIADVFRDTYAEYKQARAEETILRPNLATDWPTYRELLVRTPYSQVLANVALQLAGHVLYSELLIAGVDDGGADLFGIVNPGTVVPSGGLAYMATGNGAPLANAAMTWTAHSPRSSLGDALYRVAYAKRTAEIAAGVGKLTDVVAVTRNGVYVVTPELVAAMREQWTADLGAAIQEQTAGWLTPEAPRSLPASKRGRKARPPSRE